MPQQIIWSHFAENDFANIPDYLDRNLDRKVETARSSTETGKNHSTTKWTALN